MGLEIKTQARVKGQTVDGKLHLDSTYLTFKSKQLDWQVQLGSDINASVDGDWLTISKGRQQTSFKIETNVERWVEKILHPPDRITKLGIRDGCKFWVSPGFTREFVSELRDAGAKLTRKNDTCDVAFLRLEDREELELIPITMATIRVGCHLWVVWPKGVPEINRNEVIATAKSCGSGPGKTAAFDDELSAMRFTKKANV